MEAFTDMEKLLCDGLQVHTCRLPSMQMPSCSVNRMGCIIVYGREVGTVVGDTLITVRNSTKHYFRKYSGYALSKKTIEQAIEQGANKVIIDVVDTHETYEANLENFIKKGIRWTDQKYDEQMVLPLYHWRRI